MVACNKIDISPYSLMVYLPEGPSSRGIGQLLITIKNRILTAHINVPFYNRDCINDSQLDNRGVEMEIHDRQG